MAQLFGATYGLWIVFLVIMAVLWFVLPFAVFGVKDRLRDIIEEQKVTNELLRGLIDQQRAADARRNVGGGLVANEQERMR